MPALCVIHFCFADFRRLPRSRDTLQKRPFFTRILPEKNNETHRRGGGSVRCIKLKFESAICDEETAKRENKRREYAFSVVLVI